MIGGEDRAKREAQQYDEGVLQRDAYDSVLEHADNGPARLRRDAMIARVMATARDVAVLEIGSQAWASFFTKNRINPSNLTCINISKREIDAWRPHAARYAVNIDFRVMDAHRLEFPDEAFDFVYGTAILHHLDLGRAIPEIWRVLRPGGRMLFVEPLAANPVAKIVRKLTPHARTVDERPLSRADLEFIDRYFATDHLYTELFSVPASVASRFFFKKPDNWLTRAADAVDRAMLNAIPALGPYHRSVTLFGTRRPILRA
jgi:SAM-dependent methyltransferase